MTKEIKEILDYLRDNSKSFIICGSSYYKISDYKAKVLLDYITNLQERNNNLKEDFKRHIDRINELTERNDNLQEELEEEKRIEQADFKTIQNLEEENERLNNLINELEEVLEYDKNDYSGNIDIETHNIDSEFLRGNAWEADYILDKLKELKGDNNEETI